MGLEYNGQAVVQVIFGKLAFCKRSLEKSGSEFLASIAHAETTSHG